MNGSMNADTPPATSPAIPPAVSPTSVVETAVQGAVQKIQGRREQLREQTDRKIMQATLEIVISKGVAAVTIEEVARRSGVAKTTIYRRYRNADDLLHRIQLQVAGLPDFGDLQPSRSGLQTMLERIQSCFDSEIGLKAVGVVLSTDNDSLKTIADQMVSPAEQRFAAFIERGVTSEIFRHGLDVKFLFSTILGSMLTSKALRKDSDSDIPWSERMTALIWPFMAA